MSHRCGKCSKNVHTEGAFCVVCAELRKKNWRPPVDDDVGIEELRALLAYAYDEFFARNVVRDLEQGDWENWDTIEKVEKGLLIKEIRDTVVMGVNKWVIK